MPPLQTLPAFDKYASRMSERYEPLPPTFSLAKMRRALATKTTNVAPSRRPRVARPILSSVVKFNIANSATGPQKTIDNNDERC
jgi:hypothetical protein